MKRKNKKRKKVIMKMNECVKGKIQLTARIKKFDCDFVIEKNACIAIANVAFYKYGS